GRDLEHAFEVRLALVAQEQDVRVVAGHEELGHEVLFAGLHAARAAPAAPLFTVLGHGHTLDVARVAYGHDDVLVGHQVFHADVAIGRDDLRAAVVAVALAHFLELAADHLHQQLFA